MKWRRKWGCDLQHRSLRFFIWQAIVRRPSVSTEGLFRFLGPCAFWGLSWSLDVPRFWGLSRFFEPYRLPASLMHRFPILVHCGFRSACFQARLIAGFSSGCFFLDPASLLSVSMPGQKPTSLRSFCPSLVLCPFLRRFAVDVERFRCLKVCFYAEFSLFLRPLTGRRFGYHCK
jgi:hypothetical protein